MSITSFIAVMAGPLLPSAGMSGETFQEFVARTIRDRFGGITLRAAKAAGITSSAFGRQVKAGTLGVEALLRFAIACGENPRDVLRLAGKADVAELIESGFGPAAQRPLGDIDRAIVALPEEKKLAILRLIDPPPRTSAKGRAPSERSSAAKTRAS
jgi:hypothetical protein